MVLECYLVHMRFVVYIENKRAILVAQWSLQYSSNFNNLYCTQSEVRSKHLSKAKGPKNQLLTTIFLHSPLKPVQSNHVSYKVTVVDHSLRRRSLPR